MALLDNVEISFGISIAIFMLVSFPISLVTIVGVFILLNFYMRKRMMRKMAFASVIFLRSKLKVYLNIQIDQINDHLKKARDVKDIGHYSSGKTEITIADRSELPYTLSLIKQAYEAS